MKLYSKPSKCLQAKSMQIDMIKTKTDEIIKENIHKKDLRDRYYLNQICNQSPNYEIDK